MIGKKASISQQNSSVTSRPPSSTSSAPSASRKTSGSRSHQENYSTTIPRSDHVITAISAEPLSPVSVQSFKSVDSSPTSVKTPTIGSPSRSSGSNRRVSIKRHMEGVGEDKEKIPLSTANAAAKQGSDVAELDEPTLPMTPKSPRARSPASTSTALTITTLPTDDEEARRISLESTPLRASMVNSEDRVVVEELLSTMKQMLGTLGATFDTLGEQTMKVATLPAAMDAVHQVASVRKQLDDQHKRQEQRMQDMKTLLLEEVRSKLYTNLRETASGIVRDIVRKEITEKVRKQLHEQIPQQLRDDVVKYKRQIMEVKVSLHNSEARRHNALIRSNSLDEPFIPLLRPPPEPRPEWPLSLSIPHPAKTTLTPSGSVSAYTERVPTALPITARVFSEPDAYFGSRTAGGGGRLGRSTRLPRLDIEPPTPSPLFPKDITSLARLSPEETKALMREYGLVRVRYPTKAPIEDEEVGEETAEKVEIIEEEEPREESINRFLAYIGVGFQIVPASGNSSKPVKAGGETTHPNISKGDEPAIV